MVSIRFSSSFDTLGCCLLGMENHHLISKPSKAWNSIGHSIGHCHPFFMAMSNISGGQVINIPFISHEYSIHILIMPPFSHAFLSKWVTWLGWGPRTCHQLLGLVRCGEKNLQDALEGSSSSGSELVCWAALTANDAMDWFSNGTKTLALEHTSDQYSAYTIL